MKKFISYEKCSKKKQAEINRAKRSTWENVNPVTKIIPSKKVYKRNEKHKKAMTNVD